MGRSARGLANRTRGAELFHDWLFQSRQFDSPGAGAGHTGKRSDDTNRRAHGNCRKFGLGFRAGDFLFLALPVFWLVILPRALSRQLSAGAFVSVAHDVSAFMFGNSLGKFCDGLQAWRSVWNFSRDRFGTVLGSFLSHPAH